MTSADFNYKIQSIVEDQTHGSSVLLSMVIDLLEHENPSEENIHWALKELGKVNESMAVLHHFLREMKKSDIKHFPRSLAEYKNRWSGIEKQISEKLSRLLPDRRLKIMTHSHSGVIIKVLKSLSDEGYQLQVVQTESLPGGEGKVQADELKMAGFEVELIKDETIESPMQSVDAVLLGVDQFDERSFVNKIGSKVIVELANENGVQVYVLGDGRKRVSRSEAKSKAFEIINFDEHIHLIEAKGQN